MMDDKTDTAAERCRGTLRVCRWREHENGFEMVPYMVSCEGCRDCIDSNGRLREIRDER